MKRPKGAIYKTEEMQSLIDEGKHVFLVVPSSIARDKGFVISPNVGKLTPLEIKEIRDFYKARFMLTVQEEVDAVEKYSIAAHRNWRVHWRCGDLFFFSNFWFAHAHVQQRDDLRCN